MIHISTNSLIDLEKKNLCDSQTYEYKYRKSGDIVIGDMRLIDAKYENVYCYCTTIDFVARHIALTWSLECAVIECGGLHYG